MKKYLLFLFLFPILSFAQLGNRYFQADTLNITTVAVTETWTDVWEQVVLFADTVDVYIKIGAPDVGDWASRHWIFLPEGRTISIGPVPKLKKIEVKTGGGTGVFYIIGYKKEEQF